MAANSLPRRVLKQIFAPILPEKGYRILQSLAMGWDIRSGGWHEPEMEIIPYAVQAGDTVIDIGANYGVYSYHTSKVVGKTGKVYAFEPVPFTSETFRIIAKMLNFRNVELITKGCGDKAGTLTLRVPLSENGTIIAGIVHSAQRDNERSGKTTHARFDREKLIEADVVVLDDYLRGVKNVSLIKCDIEGADYFALRGASKIIDDNFPTIICEINPWFLEGFGVKTEQLVSFFTDKGYRLYHYENGRLHPKSIDQIVEDNWVFVHPSRRSRLASLLPAEA